MATANRARKTSSAVAVATVGEVTFENIIAATVAESFVYTSAAIHGPLIEAGLVEVNPAITNEAGELATRATEKAMNTMNAQTETPQHAKGGFVLETGVEMPSVKRGGRGGESYPFEAMQVGQSFFVGATEAKPKPAKSLASTVSSATARYATEAKDANGNVITEAATVKNYVLDEETGKRAKGEDGKLILASTSQEVRPVMVETRKFVVRSVEENGVEGARVWRIA